MRERTGPAEGTRGTDMIVSTLGAWVRSTRLAQGLSQRELADRAGMSRSYVCDIELGRGVHPSLETLDKLAASLGAARAHILQAAGYLDIRHGSHADTSELRLVRLYRDLGPESRATVERFVQFIHAEEYRWSQASFIDGDSVPARRETQAERSSLAHGRMLFDPTDDAANGSRSDG